MRLRNALAFLTTSSLIGLVGCYSNIPAAMPYDTFSDCRMSKQTNWTNESPYQNQAANRLLPVDGRMVRLYLVESYEYQYNAYGKLKQERIQSDQYQEVTKFDYTTEKLTASTVRTDGAGVTTNAYSTTLPLNDQGYDARYRYDEEGIRSRVAWDSREEKKVAGNLLQWILNDDGLDVRLTYTYDLTRPDIPRPRQFEGKTSRNLVLTFSHSGFHCCRSTRSSYQYQFDKKERVSRRIEVRWNGELPNGTLPIATYVADYEYGCP